MQKLIAGSTELDLEKGVSIPLIFKIADVKDISKRSGAFSKTIKLPGTEKNNTFFGGLYDFNADFSIFNPNIKTPCRFSTDGEEFINGYLQLKSIIRDDKGEITYDVVLYDSVVDFWSSLDKLTLGDLDWSTYDHDYTKANIEASWSGTYLNPGYYYPMHFNSVTTQKTTDFRPTPYIKNVVDKIITDAGFTWGGNLKSNPIFEKEVLQNSIDRPTISLAEAQSKTFRVSRSPRLLFHTENSNGIPIVAPEVDLDLNDETTSPNQDANNLWSVNKFTAPKVGKYRMFKHSIRFDIEMDYTVTPNFFTPQGRAHTAVIFKIVIKDDLSNIIDTITQTATPISQILFPNASFKSVTTATINGVVYSFAQQDIYLGQNWTVELFCQASGTTVIDQTNGQPNPDYTMDEVRFYIRQDSGFESQLIQYAYEDNIPLTFSDFINKKFLQKDIIKDLMVRYNCFVYADPDNPKNILFNIRDQFYATAPILDWTDKKDFNTRDQIKLIAELQNEELLLSYTKGDDPTNQGWTNAVGDDNIYGQFEYEFGNEFVKGQQKIMSPYNPTPLIQHGTIGGAIVPAINSREPIVGMRVLYVGGLIKTGSVSWSWQYRDPSGTLLTTTINGYPYAGHYDDPENPTIDINFGELPFPQYYYQLNQTTDNNLFNRYWRNTINQTADGRLVITKFNLTSSDVFFIKNNPNTRLFVDNKYYYINKINFEANQDLRALTTVELLTVEDDLIVNTGIIIVNPIKDVKETFKNNFKVPNVNPNNSIDLGLESSSRLSLTADGSDNVIGDGSQRVSIVGDNNFVDGNRTGVIIQGNNNRVFGSNVTLIGVSDITVRGDNISIINGVITKGCKTSVFFNLIDGGKDTLSPKSRECNINKICSELDGEFDLFNVSLFNLVDSEDGINDEIS